MLACWKVDGESVGFYVVNSSIRRQLRASGLVGRFFGCHAILFTTELLACVRMRARVLSGIARCPLPAPPRRALATIATSTSITTTTATATDSALPDGKGGRQTDRSCKGLAARTSPNDVPPAPSPEYLIGLKEPVSPLQSPSVCPSHR